MQDKGKNMKHFMNCDSNGRKNISLEDIHKNGTEKQFEIFSQAQIRLKVKEKKKKMMAPTATDILDLFCRV